MKALKNLIVSLVLAFLMPVVIVVELFHDAYLFTEVHIRNLFRYIFSNIFLFSRNTIKRSGSTKPPPIKKSK